MNKLKTSLIALILLTVLSQFTFAKQKDALDLWLDKYESFVEKVEDAVEKKQVSKIESFKAEHKRLIEEKDNLQKKEGNFTFKQGTRYGALNSRWGVAIGALATTKGVKGAAKKVDEFFEEE